MPKTIPFPAQRTGGSSKREADQAAARALAQRNQYVEDYAHLVAPIAKSVLRRLPPSFELDDLEQAGYIGLIKAAASYSRSKGPFKQWACWRIREHVLDAVRRKNYTAETCQELPAQMDAAVQEPAERVVPIDAHVRQSQLSAKVHRALELLNDEERTILEMYYFENAELRGVGAYLGVGMSRSSQRVRMAREQLAGRLRALGVTEAA